WCRVLKLRWDARFARTAMVVPGKGLPTVSLTTHGERISRVHIAIESIAQGNQLPGRIILWLDEPDVLDALPQALRRQAARGLEVRLSSNYGPHTKYFPYVRSEAVHHVPLATADDDVVYPA